MELNEPQVRESMVTEIRAPSLVSWGAIFAGAVVAAGVAWLFVQLGTAIGLTVVDPAEQGDVGAQSLSIGTGIWVVLTWVISLFVGGWYAGRMSGRFGRNNGMFHGLAVWGLVTVGSVIFASMGIANLIQGGASLVQGGVAMGASAAGGAGGQDIGLQAEIKRGVGDAIAKAGGSEISQQEARQAVEQLDSQTLSAIGGRLLRGDTEGAQNLIALNTTLNQNEVQAVVNNLSAQVPKYKEQIAQQAQQVTRYSSAFMWTMFVSTLIALALAMWGGAVGGRSIRDYRDAGTSRTYGGVS